MARSFSPKRVLFGLWLAFFPTVVLLWQWPINSFRIRAGILLTVMGILVGALVVAWTSKKIFFALGGLYVLAGVFLVFPASWPQDTAHLRKLYGEKLRSYEACPYVWGGEGRNGIDCSGLVRRALEDALVSEGIRTGNPALIRSGISLWWNDDTAEAMGNGYQGRTRLVTNCKSLNELDHASLLPGDLAVTEGGLHVMGYLGDKAWIGADPGEMKTTVFSIPESKNAYFSTPMKIMRWKMLED